MPRPVLLTLLGALAAAPQVGGSGLGVARAEPSATMSDSEAGAGHGEELHAEDLGEVTERIAETRRRLDELDRELAVATEEFNAERIRLAEAERAAQAAADRLRAADAAVEKAAEQRRNLATSVYRSHSLEQLSVLLTGDPATVLDRAGAVNALARRQRAAETQLRVARGEQAEAKRVADAASAERQRMVAQLEERKQAIEQTVAEHRRLLDELIARQAELERQAREREAAALRARQEAEAQAAAEAARQAELERVRLTQEAQRVDEASAAFAATPVTAAPTPAPTPAPAPAPAPAAAPASEPASGPAQSTGGSGGAARAVAEAHAQLGKPYLWGGAGPDSFDCSGLTQWVWGKAGVALSHYTGDQWNEGKRVSREELIPGDLVFFGDDLYHVGIYIGSGKMIHAPRTGEVVRIEDVWWSSFQGGVRPGA